MKSLHYSTAVLDLDGTLLTKQKIISKENQQAIHEYRARGGRVILASGRNPISVAWHARMLGLFGWHIAYDGNALVHVKDESCPEEILYIKTLDSNISSVFHAAAQHSNTQCLAFHQQNGFAQTGDQIRFPFIEHRFPLLEDQPSSQPLDWTGGFSIQVMDNWLEHINKLPLHRAIIFSEEKIAELSKHISNQSFSANISSDQRSIEISPIGISKGNTLFQLADRLEFSVEDTIAFGDGQNDISLLSAVKLGIAMGNAPENIKKIAYDVTETNNDHGVALGLKKWAYKN